MSSYEDARHRAGNTPSDRYRLSGPAFRRAARDPHTPWHFKFVVHFLLQAGNVKLQFNHRIESLRGLAAFGVLLAHSVSVFRIDGEPAFEVVPFFDQSAWAKATSLVTAVFNPSAAVVLFFVLSGYVLALSFQRRAETRLFDQVGPYLLRRSCRLLPAMWASIILLFTITQLIPYAIPREVFTTFYNRLFGPPALSSLDLARNLALYDFRANPVTWTLYVELIGSLGVPLMYGWARRFGVSGSLLLLALLIGLAAASLPYSLTLRYLFCFQLGVMLACCPVIYQSMRKPHLAISGAVILIMMDRLFLGAWLQLGLFVKATGSYLLLATLLSMPAVRVFAFLDRAPLRLLGRISYSLYLFHLPVLYLAGQALAQIGYFGMWTNNVLVFSSVIFSVVLAWAMYESIEAPMIRLGHWQGDMLQRKLVSLELTPRNIR